MPGPERTYTRELFGPWLIRQIDNNKFDGVCWLDDARTYFRIPWKHLNMKTRNERDYKIFKAWAEQSGKYDETCEDPATWKRNFRSALHTVTWDNKKVFTEVQDLSHSQEDPHKIYSVYHVPAVPLQPACIISSGPPYAHAACAVPQEDQTFQVQQQVTGGNNAFSNHLGTDEIQVNDPNAEDYKLLISPDSSYDLRLPSNGSKEAELDEFLENFNIRIDEIDVQENTQIYPHNRFSQEPVYQYTESGDPMPNGSMTLATQKVSTLFPHPGTTHQTYSPFHNGYSENVTHVAQVFRPDSESVHQTEEHVVEQVPRMASNAEAHLHGENTCALSHHQRRIPHLTEWEVTVFYKGKLVLKQNVTKKFVITFEEANQALESVDLVYLPSTEKLVDQTQIRHTNTILENVQGGLHLEVNSMDFKLYATRHGKSRVYWSKSEGVESSTNNTEANILSRAIQSEIFDFNQFRNELKDYKDNKGSSPDYTIYMSFGQILENPIMRKLVLVKLVPQFCVYTHEMLRREGVSSLNQENISLQISNGSSLNCDELDFASSMDIDFSCLI
ncbi:interferon regulatory factor 7 isoform X1 [Pelobates fuscus]|uniref:interferon regulatory factor 7 isoform X1 n=1 Tax=Pelobates fuscus TaxID=191477 RepID=UPI002FE4B06F